MAASSSSSNGEQQYSLRWNDFHSSILSSFRHLRDEEDFVDVTLACDSSSFTAHKVVLSACSPYFRRLLKANPCQHPIVILRDVASSDMESLLRFMYHGEVHVGQEQLGAFLKTAQMLQVRGLADVNSGAAAAKIPPPASSAANNGSAPTTPRNLWQDNGRGDPNDGGLCSPPTKRPRSYSPPLANHVEQKSDLQESLLGQALEGGPTIHTPSNNVQSCGKISRKTWFTCNPGVAFCFQAQSTGEDSNSMSDNEEDTSNNESILNSVKTEPADLLNDSMEHHRGTFPAALLGLQGLMPGPSGIHAANQDPNYGRWQPSGGDGSGPGSGSGWPPSGGASSARPDLAGTGTYQSGAHGSKQDPVSLLQRQHRHHQPAHHPHPTSQTQHALNALEPLDNGLGALNTLNGLNGFTTEQLAIMHQKLQNNLQSLQPQQHYDQQQSQQQVQQQSQQQPSPLRQQQQHPSTLTKGDHQLNLMLQSCSKKKMDPVPGMHHVPRQVEHSYHPQSDALNHIGKPKCPECGKIYSNNSNLKQHIVNVHTVQTEYVSCHVCSKQFKTKQYLQIHLLSMHGIRKRKCYPVYQMLQQPQHQQQQQQPSYSAADRWNEEKPN
ncbi:protein abrupt isoform X3 [Orussus abietinus]|uniref:protein abrupt isoform X3 n=1 Tax=Orussus abietinus TaxID=222816 RepID=UPI000626EB57|nr:protein abrupt isoform X3 [Orussus abietinus]